MFETHAPSGALAARKIKQGQLGSEIKLQEFEYVTCYPSASSSSSSSSSSSLPEVPVYFLSKQTVYPSDTDQTKKIVTSYSYQMHPETCRVQQRTMTLPAVPTDQNGSGTSATRKDYYDIYGNNTLQMDERGFITRFVFDTVTGVVTQRIDDVDTSEQTGVPSGWETPAGGGLNLVTDSEHDASGRPTQMLGPKHSIDVNGTATTVRRAIWAVYQDADAEVWLVNGYAYGQSFSQATLINPVQITVLDRRGQILEKISAARSSTGGKLQPTDSFPQSSYVAWSTNQYTECCLLSSMRVYHTIPSSGEGEEGTNYNQTTIGYDSAKRPNRQVSGGGTITRTVFDVRNNPVEVYVGTDDTGATDSDPTGGGATGNNMVQVTGNQFDGGNDGGDGNLAKQTQYVNSSTTRVTDLTYDWRNRATDTDGELDFCEKRYYDNLNRAVKTERYDTTSAGNLVSRSETNYYDRGRVYGTIRYGVDPSTGSVGNSLTDNTWFDASGNVIKQLPSGSDLFTKTQYDGLGRPTTRYRGFDTDETSYADTGSVTDDTILEQSEMTCDDAINVIKTVTRKRYHNATGTGALQGPTGVQPKARVTYMASWPDAIGRSQANADYGTNGGTDLSRPSTVPTRSDAVLVTSSEYDSAGKLSTRTNPGGVTNCSVYDATGRNVKQVMNCTDGSSSSSSSSSSGAPTTDDVNVTVLTEHNADGKVSEITAVNSVTGNQTTQFVYGTTLTDSDIARSDLLRAEVYPDSVDNDDRISHEYNRQGERTKTTDQNGTVHLFDFDALGREIHDRVSTLGTGVDGAVRRISTEFEVRGMREKITSYNGETVGSGSVVNEVQFQYNDFAQLTDDFQAHGGTVNTSTTPKVQYGYAGGTDNTIRPTTITYPNGRVITLDYGTGGGNDDADSRVASLIDDDGGSTHLADYSYLGENTFVEVDYTEPDIKWTMVGTAGGTDPDTGDIYRGFDRFGRIKDNYWYDYGSSTDVDRIKYGYDRNGNRTYRENTVAASLSKHFDELYGYDLIDRLATMDRGELSALKTAVSNLQFAQDWALDATGNWSGFKEDDNGSGTWDLDQQRTANKVNEITDISESSGPASELLTWAEIG